MDLHRGMVLVRRGLKDAPIQIVRDIWDSVGARKRVVRHGFS
jgi:hypothetical protein